MPVASTIMRIGYVLPMGEDTRPGVPASTARDHRLARDVEAAGFDSVWTFDHLLVQEDEGAERLGTWEAWTLLAAIAAVTERATLGVLVTCTGFREPGLLAKMAHTVHDISDGRLVLGVGAGWHEPEYRAFGYPVRPQGRPVRRGDPDHRRHGAQRPQHVHRRLLPHRRRADAAGRRPSRRADADPRSAAAGPGCSA